MDSGLISADMLQYPVFVFKRLIKKQMCLNVFFAVKHNLINVTQLTRFTPHVL